jgi:FtsP/CotA-like multicopper oxidase with cupredoxin domain
MVQNLTQFVQPGQAMIRVRQGHNVELTLKNSTDSPVSHSIDSHGVIGPGGGGKVTQTPPGATSVFRFAALHPGVFSGLPDGPGSSKINDLRVTWPPLAMR